MSVQHSSKHLGPNEVPLKWIEAAARLPGKSLHVAIAVWMLCRHQSFLEAALGNRLALRFGVDRNSKYRALGWLEDAGLIEVERRPGRPPIVTIVGIGGGQ